MAKSRFFGQKQNANMHIEHILFDNIDDDDDVNDGDGDGNCDNTE